MKNRYIKRYKSVILFYCVVWVHIQITLWLSSVIYEVTSPNAILYQNLADILFYILTVILIVDFVLQPKQAGRLGILELILIDLPAIWACTLELQCTYFMAIVPKSILIGGLDIKKNKLILAGAILIGAEIVRYWKKYKKRDGKE